MMLLCWLSLLLLCLVVIDVVVFGWCWCCVWLPLLLLCLVVIDVVVFGCHCCVGLLLVYTNLSFFDCLRITFAT